MFKVESYITPLLLSYVEKYVKNLKAEGTQVSLWGGDAVFSSLDLRTDVLERELNLPLQFVNGHIHELRIHVPWHKITSEPIVVTIDTMECVVRLPSGAGRSDMSDAGSEGSQSKPRQLRRKKQLEAEEAPPGYIQTLIRKITNNINVVCNNLILKYVEDDIVLSINVRTVCARSADHLWNPAFTDFAPPLLFLRKLVDLTDFTVCLDRRNASGKIESYQEPLLYRCSLEVRCQQQFSGLHAAVPDVTRLDALCPKLEFSITDVQVPMFLRLVELAWALMFGELAPDRSGRSSAEETAREGSGEEEAVSDTTWADWAWSSMPSPMAILPITWDEAEEEDEAARLAAHERVFHLSVHVERADTVLKMSETVREAGQRRTRFTPYLRVSAAGAFASSVVRGVHAVSTGCGVSYLMMQPCGSCTCQAPPLPVDGTQASYLEMGRRGEEYLTGSLFETAPSEPIDTRHLYHIDWDAHMRERTESWMMERSSAFAMDYLYVLDLPDDAASDTFSELGDLEYSNMPERSMLRLVVGKSRSHLGSGAVHRFSQLLRAASSASYPPYRQYHEPGPESAAGPPPVGELEVLEANTPARGLQLTILEPQLTVLTGHGDDTEGAAASGAVRLELRCQTLHWNEQQPMYPVRLSRCVSNLTRPPAAMLYNCHVHTRSTVTAGQAELVTSGVRHRVASLSSASLYWKRLALPKFWAGSQYLLSEIFFHADWLHLELSAHQGGELLTLYQSVVQATRSAPFVQLTAPDVHAVVQTDVRGLEVKVLYSAWCRAGSVSLTSVSSQLSGRPVLVAPQSTAGSERAVRALLQLPTDQQAARAPPLLVVVSQPMLLCWQPALLHWLSLAAVLLAVPPPASPPQAPPPPPPTPPAVERGSARSGRRSPAVTNVPHAHGSRQSRSGRSTTTETVTRVPAAPPPPPPVPPPPPASPPLLWLSALERLEVRLDIGHVTVTVPAGRPTVTTAGGAPPPPPPSPPSPPSLPVPGRVRSSNASSQYCLEGQLVSVLPTVRMVSTGFKNSTLPLVPDVPVLLPDTASGTERTNTPWSARLCGCEVYVELGGGERRPLVDATDVECTLGLSGGADNHLSLVLHANTPALALTLGQQQIHGLAHLVEQWFAVQDRLAPLMPAPCPEVIRDDFRMDSGTRGSLSEEVSAQRPADRKLSDNSGVAGERTADRPLSLWLQWTLPRLSAVMVGPVGTDRLLMVVEDLALSLDAQPIYTKAKLNVASLEVSRQDSGPQPPGPVRSEAERIIFTSWRRLTQQLTMVAGRPAVSPEPTESDSPDQPAHKALLAAVWTRALRSNVLEKWGCARTGPAGWLTELEVRLKPCDLVLTPDIVLPFSRLVEPLVSLLLARRGPPPPAAAPAGLAANSQSLPLVYVSADTVRLFLPSAGAVCLLQVARLRLEPTADFPLSRPVLRPDLVSAAQSAGTFSLPGADVEDRHYQADVRGVLVATGVWEEVLAQSGEASLQSSQPMKTMGENPAVEWNNYNPLQSPREVTMISVLDSTDFRVTLAPAIVSERWRPAGVRECTLVAGHALELNVGTPLAVSVSGRQAALLARLAEDAVAALRQLVRPAAAPPPDPAQSTHAPGSPPTTDSGIGSCRAELATAAWVPFEMLLTLGELTATLYDHAAPTEGHGCGNHLRPVPLLHVSVSQPHVFLACRPTRQKLQLSAFDIAIRAAPPSVHSDSEDRGPFSAVPEPELFTLSLLETRPGQAHPKTGIPPALFTVTLEDFVTARAALSVDVCRPLRCCWNWAAARRLETVVTLAQHILPCQTSLDASQSSEGSVAAGPAADAVAELCEETRRRASLLSDLTVTCCQLVLELDTRQDSSGAGCHLRVAVSTLSAAVRCQYPPSDQLPSVLAADLSPADLTLDCSRTTGRWRPLLGPWSPVVTAELEWETWSPLPYGRVHVVSDAVVVDVGPEQLLCLESLLKAGEATPTEAVPPHRRNGSVCDLASVVNKSEDDLRRGHMSYAQGRDTECPLNHVSFDKGSGVMSWHYPEPRSLSSVQVFPVPFVAGSEFSSVSTHDTSEVNCALQYFDRLRRRFATLCRFQLSESQTCRLQLPIPVQTSKAPTAALWRVRINVTDTESPLPPERVSVCPTALAACLRVDSEFRPSAVARLRAAADLGGVQVHLHVQQPSGPADWPQSLDGYTVTTSVPADHAFLTVSADGASVSAAVWPDMKRLEADGALAVTVVNYAFLTETSLLDKTPVKVDAVYTDREDRPQLELLTTAGPTTLRLTPSSAHTLATAVVSWRDQLVVRRGRATRHTRLVHTRYVLLNNTGCPLRLGQLGTVQCAPLSPHTACLYSWPDRRQPPLLRLSLPDAGGWSEPFSVEKDGVTVRHLIDKEASYPIIITVKPFSTTQKQVTIEGRLRLVNGLDCAVWVNAQAAPVSQVLTVAPRSASPTVVCVEASMEVAAVTDQGRPLYRTVDMSSQTAALVQLSGCHAWCRTLHETASDGTLRTLVVLVPVFCIRSLLPTTLELMEAPGDQSTQIHGRGAFEHLNYDPSVTHRLTMKLRADSQSSSPPLFLSVGALEQCPVSSEVPVLEDLLAALTAPDTDWLPDDPETSQLALDQPDISLKVTLDRRWPWLNTLLVDIRPSLLVVNQCPVTLALRCGQRSAEPSYLPPGAILAPPLTEGSFFVSVLTDDEEYQSCVLQLGEQDWPYQRPLPSLQGVVPPDGATRLGVFVKQTMVLLCVDSTLRGGLRCLHVRPAVLAVNETGRRLPLVALAAAAAAAGAGPRRRLPEVRGAGLAADSRPQPLLWWQLADGISPDPAAVPQQLRLLLDLSGCRQSPLALTTPRGSAVLHGPSRRPHCSNSLFRVSHLEKRGQTFITVRDDDTPYLLVKNHTKLAIVVHQPGTVETADVFVTAAQPGEVAAGQSRYFPSVELPPANASNQHRLRLSIGEARLGQSHPATDSQSGRDTLAADRATIDLTYGNTQFLHVSGHDLTAHVHVRGHTHHVQLRPVSRLEVSARDVRARLARSAEASASQSAPTPTLEPTCSRPESAAEPELGRTVKSELKPIVDPKPEPTVDSALKPAVDPELKPAVDPKPECEPESELDVQLTAACDRLTVVLADDTTDVAACQEVLRLTADTVALLLAPTAPHAGRAALARLSVCVADLQLDSQLPPSAGQHFPVLLAARDPAPPTGPLSVLPPLLLSAAVNSLRRSALLLAEVGLQADGGRRWLRSLRLAARPLRIYVEDRCHADFEAYLRQLAAASRAEPAAGASAGLPADVAAQLATLSNQVCVDRLVVEPLQLQLSVRTQLRLYLSIDESPLQLPALERVAVRCGLEQLLDDVVRHYMWSAIYKAGGVVASLDLLGDPAGLARSMTTGVRDLVRLPARGLLGGPAALLAGCAAGVGSLTRHLAAGTVSSVSALAAALAHNLHRLSLDADHLARAERQRGTAPLGLLHGVTQGLTGFGMGLLGAVAGIADQPLQGVLRDGSPAALVGGLGRGLVGAVTKPLGGAADLVAHTGEGLLYSAGWRVRPQRRHQQSRTGVAASRPSALWYAAHLLTEGDVLAVVEASQLTDTNCYLGVTVVLTSQDLRLLAEDVEPLCVADGARHQLTETDLCSSPSDPTELTLHRRTGLASSPRLSPPHSQTSDMYVAEYVRGAAGVDWAGRDSTSGGLLVTLFVSPERRPLLLSAFRAAQQRAFGRGFTVTT